MPAVDALSTVVPVDSEDSMKTAAPRNASRNGRAPILCFVDLAVIGMVWLAWLWLCRRGESLPPPCEGAVNDGLRQRWDTVVFPINWPYQLFLPQNGVETMVRRRALG